ncbi:FCD domain-containing protein, partial [Acinetobacter baumannii]
SQVGRFTRMQVSMAAGKERPQREHHALLAACRDNDIAGAVRMLEAHIAQTQTSLVAAARRGAPAGLSNTP